MSSMFNVNTYAGNTMNSIFKSLNTNQSSGLSSLLGDYYSIKNGSYYKMAKKYYGKVAADDAPSKADTSAIDKDKLESLDKSTSLSGKKTTDIMKLADKTVKSLEVMMDDKLYDKADGNDDILDDLKGFVSDYNAVIKRVSKSGDLNTVQSGERLKNQTAIYGSALEKIGVNIGEDSTLSIDEEVFKNADMAEVRSLFTGTVSFGKNTQMKLLQVYSAEATGQTGINSLYSSQGTTGYSIGNMFDSLF